MRIRRKAEGGRQKTVNDRRKVNCRLFLVLLLLLPSTFYLLPVLYAQQKPKTYSVWVWQENGDCLWKIAEKFYGDGKKWKIIYEANKNEIKDPRKIYPKQKLIIP